MDSPRKDKRDNWYNYNFDVNNLSFLIHKKKKKTRNPTKHYKPFKEA